MLYYLCKLDFLTALHIGDSSSARSLETSKMAFGSDTLFSALCHEALSLGGTTMLEQLYQLTKEDKLLLSDSMPYYGETLYIPRPVAPAANKTEGDPGLRKRHKKMAYLPMVLMDRYLTYLRGEADFEVRLAEDELRAGESGDLPVVHTQFGTHSTVAKVAVQGNEDPEPFHVGAFSFFKEDKQRDDNKLGRETCGLYIIIGYAEEGALQLVLRLLKSLAVSGIGGKTSAGYGKFIISDDIFVDEVCDEQTEWLKRSLHYQNAKSFLLLNLALPKEDEMPGAVEGSTYALERRGGFVQSKSYGTTFYKKKTGYLFAAGSVFKKTFQGDVFDVAAEGAHPVYRYGKPMFLGVDL